MSRAPGSPDAIEGYFTLGVEEEYQLVDPETMGLRNEPSAVGYAQRHLGEHAQSEISGSQLEISTPICRSLADVRAALRTARQGAAKGAEQAGVRLLAAATHPFSTWQDQRLTLNVRYIELYERWGLMALQQTITGCHVHVGLPSREVTIAVLDRVRPYLSVLLALTGSSPLWEGIDTGYSSYRTQWYDRWPVTGVPDLLGSVADFDTLVRQLVATGIVADSSHLYWDVRPSQRHPTLEYRVADVCTTLDDAVLHAALARSLTRVTFAGLERGGPAPEHPMQLLRAARWRAARWGLDESLVDVLAPDGSWRLRPAGEVVEGLLARLRDDLEEHGEWEEVRSLTNELLGRGTSALRQRRLLARSGGNVTAVARWLVEETAG
ncbi:MAG: glutamate--cysteine ligase [Actinomycetota bacterium]|nr:glutamate--cysteine ligase [Actinomycetota bacterium]